MPDTIFIALQCCQCSIMQVKQMKKSSNKWTCVVCNQKQSVRKVFAQGYMAKDLRQFVQSFNISRGSQESEQSNGFEPGIEKEMPNKKSKLNNYINTTSGEEDGERHKTILESQDQVRDLEPRKHEQTRPSATSKWSIYMTQEDEKQEDEKEPMACRETKTMNMAASKWSNYITQDDDMVPTTCQPKKPMACGATKTMNMAASKWSNYITQDDDMEPTTCQPKQTDAVSKWSNYMTQDDMEPEPKTCRATATMAASKWSTYKTQDDMDPRIRQPTMTKAAAKRSNYKTKGDIEPRACQATTMAKAGLKWRDYMTEDNKDQRVHLTKEGNGASKWNNYLTQDEDEFPPENGRKFADDMGDWSNSVFETTTHDQEVEDDIHPDFI